jgi:hypothetical protein
MKFLLLAAALMLFAAPVGGAAPRQSAAQCKTPRPIVSKQIRFEKGRTTAVIKDRVARCTTNQYRLRAREGQTMNLNLVAGEHTTLTLWSPLYDMIIDGVKTWSEELRTSGDYFIDVTTDEAASYTLEVTIR